MIITHRAKESQRQRDDTGRDHCITALYTAWVLAVSYGDVKSVGHWRTPTLQNLIIVVVLCESFVLFVSFVEVLVSSWI
jgi:hypothetical protein